MALTAHDILMDADLFRRVYPEWPHAGPSRLDEVRASCLAAGFTAESGIRLDPEAERLARLEREDAQ